MRIIFFNAIEHPIRLDKNTETFINNSANVYNKNTRDKKGRYSL